MPKRSKSESAALEAYEEAGVRGKMSARPIGKYAYDKIRDDLTALPCVVSVYLLRVDEILDDWPEAGQRDREWFNPVVAAQAVSEPDLARLLHAVAEIPLHAFGKKAR